MGYWKISVSRVRFLADPEFLVSQFPFTERRMTDSQFMARIDKLRERLVPLRGGL